MKQNLSILVLLVTALVAVVSGQNSVPPGTTAQGTPTKPDAAADIKVVSAPYHAAVETVSADYQKWVASLETWYLAELDKLQAARAKLGDLDGAIAIKKERERMASHSPTTPEQIQAMPAPLRTLRAGYDQGLKKSADEGARRIDVSRRKYLADLEALQKRITISGDIDQALAVKAEKERFIAEMAADPGTTVPQPPPPPVAPPPPPVVVKPPVPSSVVPMGTRLAEKMTIHVSGNNYCSLNVNGKEVTKFGRDNASKVSLSLREGDVIAVRLGQGLDQNSLWLSCIASTGEFLFETNEQWVNYIPADTENWWNIKDAKEQKTSQFAPDEQTSVGHVKRAAATTPLYRDAQPIKGTISSEPKAVFLYHVVTKMDLVPKNDRKSGGVGLPAPNTGLSPSGVAAASDSVNSSVKALVAGSRWVWFDSPDFSGKAYWHEFYRDGSARNSWGRSPTWDIIPPNTLHIFDPADNRHWRLDIDVGKRIAVSNPDHKPTHNSMRYEKIVSAPPPGTKKK